MIAPSGIGSSMPVFNPSQPLALVQVKMCEVSLAHARVFSGGMAANSWASVS
ncbi:MAG: hypothetical protein ACK56F_00330 [bacterium]